MSEDLPEPPLTAKDLFARYHMCVLPVFTTDAIGDEHVGSAFHVGEGAFVTARHIGENQVSCRIPRPDRGPFAIKGSVEKNAEEITIDVKLLGHPDPTKDVAVFSAREWSDLPAIPLGSHLDDWISDGDFMLSEVVVMGFPPIPLSNRAVLIAARGEVNAVVDLIQSKHPHFLISVIPRGGFSGRVVLTQAAHGEFALGIITSSLVKNGAPEELGYLTVLTVEPILECLGHHYLLPHDLVLMWNGLFTSSEEYFGVPEKRWAHTWLEVDRDGHRTRLLLGTPDEAVIAQAVQMISGMDIETIHEILPVDVHCWSLVGDHTELEAPLERCRVAVRQLLLDRGHLPVRQPVFIKRSLEPPETEWLTGVG